MKKNQMTFEYISSLNSYEDWWKYSFVKKWSLLLKCFDLESEKLPFREVGKQWFSIILVFCNALTLIELIRRLSLKWSRAF